MNELLKKLFEAELLTADSKKELEEAFASQMADLITETKASTEAAVRVELAEQWLSTREELVEAIDSKVQDLLAEEMKELQAEFAAFRDLEVEYAGKLQEAKDAMAEQFKGDMAELLGQMDTFLEAQIQAEFNELKADLKEAQKNVLGRQIFEAFATEYQAKFIDGSEVATKLAETEAKLAQVSAQLSEASVAKAKVERALKLESILAPLQGTSRQLMETILSSVDTKDLEKAYTKYVGRVLKENAADKETPVLSEGQEVKPVIPPTGAIKTGDVITESKKEETAGYALSAEEKRQLQRRAGIID